MTKRCSKCDRNLPLDSYHRTRRNKDGHIAKCKECRKKLGKEYRARPEVQKRHKEYMKEYHARPDVKEMAQEYMKEYYARPDVKEHKKDRMKKQWKEYYARPDVKERKKEYRKEYFARPEVQKRMKDYRKGYNARPGVKERNRIRAQKRKAMKRNLPHDLTADEWQDTLSRFDGKCVYCGDQWEHQEHLWPLSKGGGYTRTNIVPACAPCNISKHNKYPAEFITKDALYEILHTLGVH